MPAYAPQTEQLSTPAATPGTGTPSKEGKKRRAVARSQETMKADVAGAQRKRQKAWQQAPPSVRSHPTMQNNVSAVGGHKSMKCRPRRFAARPLDHRTSNPAMHTKWTGAGSNRRHLDFQSSALPTELPVRREQTENECGTSASAQHEAGSAPLCCSPHHKTDAPRGNRH